MTQVLPADQRPGKQIVLQIAPADIDFLTRIMEGYDGLGMVSTVDSNLGLVVIWVTAHTEPRVLEILADFPRPLTIQ